MSDKSLFADEGGFTTTSMVLSLLITLSLIFTSAQVYRLESASAEVQDVADAAALAAETQVAEYMLIARLCDAVVLSLSLTGLTVLGLGIAALCTPQTAGLSVKLIASARNVLEMRDKFSERSVKVLEKLQRALPFFAAACAAGVAQANNADSSGAAYAAIAILVPSAGSVNGGHVGSDGNSVLDDVEENADDIRAKAEEAEKAAQEANRSKERAFKRDCGDNPSYCMYERAKRLAGLSGSANPLFSSVDAWSFSVALNRARAYYQARSLNEAPQNSSLAEQARSALRARFYRYAQRELAHAYVHEDAGSFDARFPHLPKNTRAMRLTDLYTDPVYPITEDAEGRSVMHAWAGCPEAAATLARGSIQQMEEGDFATCPVCEFTASSMGTVAAASTSIPNGFEYHYDAVAREAVVYQDARHRADEPKAEVQDKVGKLVDDLIEAMGEAAGKRIVVEPPGRYGAVALVVNSGSMEAAGAFGSAFVAVSGQLGPRAGLAAATLVDEGTEEGSTVISSLLDNLDEHGGVFAGAAGIVLDCWSWLLKVYCDGQTAIAGGIEKGLNALPLQSASGLGSWAAGALRKAAKTLGLQPAKIGALKPVLVNSFHVASHDNGSWGKGLVSVKGTVHTHPLMSTDLFGSLLSDAERAALAKVEGLGDSIDIATIELIEGGGASIPVTLALPDFMTSSAADAVSGLFDRIRSLYAQIAEVRVWE